MTKPRQTQQSLQVNSYYEYKFAISPRIPMPPDLSCSPSSHYFSRVLGSLASNCQILGHLDAEAGVADDVEDDHVSEELIELVPDLIWAVVKTGEGEQGLSSSSENLVMAPSPDQPSPSFLETMFILILIHLLFEFIR